MKRAALLLAIVAGGCSSPPPEPKTYEDCILRHLTPGQSNGAVGLIRNACRAKFPLPVGATVERSYRSLPDGSVGYFEGDQLVRVVPKRSPQPPPAQ